MAAAFKLRCQQLFAGRSDASQTHNQPTAQLTISRRTAWLSAEGGAAAAAPSGWLAFGWQQFRLQAGPDRPDRERTRAGTSTGLSGFMNIIW